MDELPKEAHESPMLSLDKTKDREVTRIHRGSQNIALLENGWSDRGSHLLSGKIAKSSNPWNGVVGEVITNNVRVFDNIPLKIPYQGELTLRGEAIITYSEFEKNQQSN